MQVLLAEGDGANLCLALFDVDLIFAEYDEDMFADALQVTVPVGCVLVSDLRRYVKHEDTALPLEIVAISRRPPNFY